MDKVLDRDHSRTLSSGQSEPQGISGHMNSMKQELLKRGELISTLFTAPAVDNRVACISREEFAQHGMDEIVTLTHRNVCKDGFTVTDTANAGMPFSYRLISKCGNRRSVF